MIRMLCLCFLIAIGVTGCGDDDEAYTEGYNDGQYDVCRELEGVAPAVKDQLSHCRGY